ADIEQPQLPAQDTGAAAVPTSIHALHTLGRAAQTDIGAMLNLDDLLVPDTPSSTGEAMLPVNAYGQAVMQAPVRALATPPAPRKIPNPDPDDDSLARRVERLANAAKREMQQAQAKPNGAGNGNNAQLFDVNTGL